MNGMYAAPSAPSYRVANLPLADSLQPNKPAENKDPEADADPSTPATDPVDKAETKPLAEAPRSWFNCLQGAPRIQDGVIRLNDAPGFGVSVVS